MTLLQMKKTVEIKNRKSINLPNVFYKMAQCVLSEKREGGSRGPQSGYGDEDPARRNVGVEEEKQLRRSCELVYDGEHAVAHQLGVALPGLHGLGSGQSEGKH